MITTNCQRCEDAFYELRYVPTLDGKSYVKVCHQCYLRWKQLHDIELYLSLSDNKQVYTIPSKDRILLNEEVE